jgi:hypothetical protein
LQIRTQPAYVLTSPDSLGVSIGERLDHTRQA